MEVDTDLIAGYDTLSSASIDLDQLPEAHVKRLPRYPAVPVIKIGRLAVDTSFQGSGLSKAMLADIYKRVMTWEVGVDHPLLAPHPLTQNESLHYENQFDVCVHCLVRHR